MAITLTLAAAKELDRLLEKQGYDAKIYLRVSVLGGGCSGYNYHLALDTDEISDLDLLFPSAPVNIVCDPKSFLYLNGTIIDFEEGLMGKGFVFNNPQAKRSCGCGESFSV